MASPDARDRRYALRAVRPSPARLDAPEPDVWLPILDLTEELATLDFTGELELIALEEGRVDLERELVALESDFWRSAEAEHPFLTGELPVIVAPPVDTDPVRESAQEEHLVATAGAGGPVGAEGDPAGRDEPIAWARTAPVVAPAEPVGVEPGVTVGEARPTAAAVAPVFPDPLPVPEEEARTRPTRPAIAHRRRVLRLRRRVILTALVVIVAAACVGATARVFGGTDPRRDVTLAVDGRATTMVTRAGTVSDLLAANGVVLRDGDRVVPSLSTQLQQGISVQVVRAFPIVVDLDGVVAKRQTTYHDLAGVRRELGVPTAMVRVSADGRLIRDSRVVLRTPHSVTLVVDGTTTPLPAVTALTVGELLASRHITLGAQDEVQPALETRLSAGITVQAYRLANGEVAEEQVIPYRTEPRDDSTLSAGQTAVIQAGQNGRVRVVSKVVRRDGTIIQSTEDRREVIVAPVPEIVRRGTKRSGGAPPVSPPATASGGRLFQSGTATWYDSHAGAGSCAHLTLPFGTIVKIVASNGRTAECRVGDRGPEAYTGNIIDLNRDVFGALAPLGAGVISVQLFIL